MKKTTEKIEFTLEEIQTILNTLGEIPLKYSLALNNFILQKVEKSKELKSNNNV